LNQRNFLTAGLRRRIRAILLEEAAGLERGWAVDVGCGTGSYIDALPVASIGTDINAKYLQFLRKRTFRVLAADAVHLSLKSDSVMFVYCVNMLHHVDDTAMHKILWEMWRVCRKGGKLVVMDAVRPPSPWNVIGHVLRRLDRGKYLRHRAIFREMVRAFAAEVNECVRFSDFQSHPHDQTMAVIHKRYGAS
jgi:ubiquinone/menaquinone biosynthesis C-methylase UbiE